MGKLWARRSFKQKAAAERKEASDIRTPQEQLAKLDLMLGTGVGAVKERAKLAEKIREFASKVNEI